MASRKAGVHFFFGAADRALDAFLERLGQDGHDPALGAFEVGLDVLGQAEGMLEHAVERVQPAGEALLLGEGEGDPGVAVVVEASGLDRQHAGFGCWSRTNRRSRATCNTTARSGCRCTAAAGRPSRRAGWAGPGRGTGWRSRGLWRRCRRRPRACRAGCGRRAWDACGRPRSPGSSSLPSTPRQAALLKTALLKTISALRRDSTKMSFSMVMADSARMNGAPA